MDIINIIDKNIYDRFTDENNMNILFCSRIHILDILKLLKSNGFNMLTDLSAIDHLGRELRWEIIYNLLNIEKNQRIVIKAAVNEEDAVDSVSELYKAAIWYEREVWDMYGIEFKNHPDLRRILSDYGFKGHPLRKDFPLTGYVEVRYDYTSKKVIYEPVKLSQEYRNFDFLSPWEGTDYVLPYDQKTQIIK